MDKYYISVKQSFQCAFEVEANSEDEAWDILLDGMAMPVDQYPEEIISSREDADIRTNL